MGGLSTLGKGAIASLIVNVLGIILVFVAQVVLARALTLQDFGIYSLAISYLTVLVLLGCAGFDAALLRLVPALSASSKFGELRGLLRYSSVVVLLFSAALGVAAYVVISYVEMSDSVRATSIIATILLPVMCLNQLRQAVLRGFNCVFAARVPDILVRPAILILLSYLLISSIGSLTASLAMLVHLIAATSALLLGTFWQFGKLPEPVKSATPAFSYAAWHELSCSLMAIGALTVLGNEIDKLAIGALVSTEDVGLYAAASRLAYFVMFGVDSVLTAGAPLLARQHTAEGKSGLQTLVNEVNRLIVIVTIPIVLIFVGGGAYLLSLFGAEFAVAYPTLLILAIGYLCNVFFGPAGFALNMTGGHVHTLRISLIATTLQVPLVAFGAYCCGINGAALAMAAVTILKNILLHKKCRELLGIDSRAFATRTS